MKIKKMTLLAALLIMVEGINGIQASLTTSQKSELLSAHNYFRGKVDPIATDMQRLVWDDELAYIAQFWAANCQYGYNIYRNLQSAKYNYVGETVTYSTNSYVNYTLLVYRWFSLGRRYNYYQTYCRNQDGSRSVDGEDCSPYRQLVWADTYAVGCGVMRCEHLYHRDESSVENALYLVCNYGPGGSFEGHKPYRTGNSVCSNCPSNTPHCVRKLCSAQKSSSCIVSIKSMLLSIVMFINIWTLI